MSAITAAPLQPTRAAATRQLLRVVQAEWERTLAWTLAVAAAVLLYVGYRNVAASPFAAEEVAHLITGGIGALVLLVAAVGLLLAADLCDEADKLDRIEARLGRSACTSTSGSGAAASAFGDDPAAARPVRGVRVACAAAMLLGFLALAAGWARAAGTAEFDRSLTGLALAVFGFAAITAAVAAHSLAARRLVRRRIGALVAAGSRNAANPAGEATAADGREWTADGLARFHRRSCPALASAPGAARLVDGQAARLEPCLICHVED